jgi:hypothetical protein
MNQTEALTPDSAAPLLQAPGAAICKSPRKAVLQDLSQSNAPPENLIQQCRSGCGNSTLHAGLADGRFLDQPQALFRLRLQLNDIVQQSLQLELHASGGRAYHRDQPLGFARRWREAAFIPIVTPSVTQLQGALAGAAPAGAALATTNS